MFILQLALLLSTAAHGQGRCDQIANMVAAQVPDFAIIEDMRVSGYVFSRDELQCLEARGVPSTVVIEAHKYNDRGVTYRALEPQVVPAAQSATVSVDVYCGSIEVVGADIDQVRIAGRVQHDGRLGVISEDPDHVRIVVTNQGKDPQNTLKTVPDGALPSYRRPTRAVNVENERGTCAEVRLEVPRRSRVVVKSSKASIRALWLTGELDLHSYFGAVEVVAPAEEVRVVTTRGGIRIDTTATHVTATSVGGPVEVAAAPGARVRVETVGGAAWLWGGPFRRAEVQTVSGDIHFQGAAEPRGQLIFESHKGNIEALMPPSENLRLQTYEGTTVQPGPEVRTKPPSGPLILAREGDADRFTRLSQIGVSARGLFDGGELGRWWFDQGAYLSRRYFSNESDFSVSAMSFSGDVKLGWSDVFPAETVGVIEAMEARRPQLDACAAAESDRRPANFGNVVATFSAKADGVVSGLEAPGRYYTNAAKLSYAYAADAPFQSCVVEALDGLKMPAGAEVDVAWPVSFRAAREAEEVEVELEVDPNAPMVRPNSAGHMLTHPPKSDPR